MPDILPGSGTPWRESTDLWAEADRSTQSITGMKGLQLMDDRRAGISKAIVLPIHAAETRVM